MARPLRIEFPGAACHLMARSHQGRGVLADDQDRGRFLETLGRTCENSVWVSERLQMGHPAHVRHAVSQMNRAMDGKLQRLQRQLASEPA
jgi:hypothetical protein